MASEGQRSGIAIELAEARAASREHLELLRARARALARGADQPAQAAGETTLQAIVFQLGEERYALDTKHVLRVAVLKELTPLPGARPPLSGLTEWRGGVLTVLDLRSALGASARGITDLGRLIVMSGVRRPFGVLVERLVDIVEIDAQRLKALPREDGRQRSLLRGVTDDAVLLIDAETLVESAGVSAGRGPRRRGGIE